MVIQLISDVHSELWTHPTIWVAETCGPALESRQPDVLLLAGDIVQFATQSLEQIDAVFGYFAARAKHVIYVPGNHEYWHGYRHQEHNIAALAARYKNFHWLQNDQIVIDGVQFFGGTLWFPWEEDTHFRFESGPNAWSDFIEIKDFLKTKWAYKLNDEFRQMANIVLRPGAVVISHHLPNHRSIPEKFRAQQNNRFFVSDETELIFRKEPRLWVHGHTHANCDYQLDQTRIVCNPLGYHPRPYPPVSIEI